MGLHKKIKSTTDGFTLVELLIVIVIIAILSAISIVSYNGIRERAEGAQYVAAFDAYEKAIMMYYNQYDSYPIVDNPDKPYACLGSGYTQTADFTTGECFKVAGHVFGVVNATTNNEFQKVMSGMPILPSKSSLSSGDEYVRGIFYYSTNAGNFKQAELSYYARGNQQCGRGSKDVFDIDSEKLTICTKVWLNGDVQK